MRYFATKIFAAGILGTALLAGPALGANVHVYKAILPGDRLICTSLFTLAYIESYNQDRIFLGPRRGGAGLHPDAEVANSREFIYGIYQQVLGRGQRDKVFNDAFIASIRHADKNLPADHVLYFVAWDPSETVPLGVMRVVNGGDSLWWGSPSAEEREAFVLPLEMEFKDKLQGKIKPLKLEYGRLATVPGPYRLQIGLDLVSASLNFLFNRYQDKKNLMNDYRIYVHADRATAMLYQLFRFNVLAGPETLGVEGHYILEKNARDFFMMFRGHFDEAAEAYDFYTGKGDPRRALELVNTALAQLPARFQGLFGVGRFARARLNLVLGNFDAAAAEIKALLGHNPLDVEAKELALEIQVARVFDLRAGTGNTAQALELIEAEIIQVKSLPDLHSEGRINLLEFPQFLKARILILSGRYDEARAVRADLQAAKYDLEELNYAIRKEADRRRPITAEANLTNLDAEMRHYPWGVNPFMFLLQARLLKQLSRNDEALKQARVAQALQPDNQEISDFLRSFP